MSDVETYIKQDLPGPLRPWWHRKRSWLVAHIALPILGRLHIRLPGRVWEWLLRL